MAVARAQARGGVSGIHIWLIAFVALWLTSTVLLVLLYTDQKDLVSQNEQLQRSAQSDADQLRQARAAQAAIAELATGAPQDPPEVVRTKVGDLRTRIAQERRLPNAAAFTAFSALEALETLYQAFTSENQKLAQANQQNAQLAEQVAQLADANSNQVAQFNAQVSDFERQLAETREEWEQHRAERDREVDGFNQQLKDIDARANKDIQIQREETKRVLAKFEELHSRFTELKARLGELQITPQELITARQPDGYIVAAEPAERVVYINLGREARLVLGLQFAVYSAASGIPADGRAKARIEVVNIFDYGAECRVVQVHGREPVIEGDLVANPVFDPSRPMKFMVIGRFDLDGDGEFEPEGARQIELLIQNWGGEVVDELSAQVDFTVVGAAPRRPVVVGDPTVEAQARFEAEQKVYLEFNDMLARAQGLSIPILIQSVFMHFLGYAA